MVTGIPHVCSGFSPPFWDGGMEGIDPPRPNRWPCSVQVEVTPENWVRSRNAEDEDPTYSKKPGGSV